MAWLGLAWLGKTINVKHCPRLKVKDEGEEGEEREEGEEGKEEKEEEERKTIKHLKV